MKLWSRTLNPQSDGFDAAREILRQSFLSFRLRVADLVSTISGELPNLTVHDITHIDALWRVAGEIAGPDYPLNAAEAYVLGGAFLLHDAAHVLAAYPGRLAEVKQSIQWQDFVAHRRNGVDPIAGSSEEKSIIFQVLRHLHAEQAHKLSQISWKVDPQSAEMFLIENHQLREYFGDLIGQVAASHHWTPSKVVSVFKDRAVSSPAFLFPATWQVDVLKVAFLLRTADAAHLDGARAPWFLFALQRPEGISAEHWRFQAKIGQPTITTSGEIRFNSGSPFSPRERNAWWLAFETARMVDRELQIAHEILKEEGRPAFAAHGVQGTDSAASFARSVPVRDWEPIDIAPRVGNIPALITSLGGAALYGDDSTAPLRELLQNGIDAVCALRALGGASSTEGSVNVAVKPAADGDWWLEVTDTGIGMSRHVLTTVLLDFGTSLWSSDAMREELPGLAKSGFRSVGKFGIGFFSVFMLGDEVRVTTRRYEQAQDGSSLHWQLRFEEGLGSRPVLVQPAREEMLPRPGTRVAVRLSDKKLRTLLDEVDFDYEVDFDDEVDLNPDQVNVQIGTLAARICPASSVDISTQTTNGERILVVSSNDWIAIPDQELMKRVGRQRKKLFPLITHCGKLLGRLCVADTHYDNSSIVFQGIVCGIQNGLEGVVTARENNRDARRANSIPSGSLAEWNTWAKSVVEGSTGLNFRQISSLHPLIPESDLAVWVIGQNLVTFHSLLREIESRKEIVLYQGEIDHESEDDVSSSGFLKCFNPIKNLVCCPDSNSPFRSDLDFPWSIGAQRIDYIARFEAGLKSKWGKFARKEFDGLCVGEVRGIEILREVSRYVKVKQP
jgi:hypothetical protein